MNHRVKHNHLGRNTNQAKALYRSLSGAIIEHGRIQTTLAKAKAVSGMIDKLVNLGKSPEINARREVVKILGSDRLVPKLFSDLAPKLAGRNSGYTRIIKAGPRMSDTSQMVYLEFLVAAPTPEPEPKIEKKPKKVLKKNEQH